MGIIHFGPDIFLMRLRRIRIDFLAPEAGRGSAGRWLPGFLWASALAFAAWEINLAQQMATENVVLAASTNTTKHPAAAAPAEPADSALPLLGAPLVTSSLLAVTEGVISKIRRGGADLRLDNFVVDASRRTLLLRGDSSEGRTIDLLATELRTAFPQSSAGFPDVRHAAGRARFEILLHFPATGAKP